MKKFNMTDDLIQKAIEEIAEHWRDYHLYSDEDAKKEGERIMMPFASSLHKIKDEAKREERKRISREIRKGLRQDPYNISVVYGNLEEMLNSLKEDGGEGK